MFYIEVNTETAVNRFHGVVAMYVSCTINTFMNAPDCVVFRFPTVISRYFVDIIIVLILSFLSWQGWFTGTEEIVLLPL